jgi:hypothetical protein
VDVKRALNECGLLLVFTKGMLNSGIIDTPRRNGGDCPNTKHGNRIEHKKDINIFIVPRS